MFLLQINYLKISFSAAHGTGAENNNVCGKTQGKYSCCWTSGSPMYFKFKKKLEAFSLTYITNKF
jgi:hypothetical protein